MTLDVADVPLDLPLDTQRLAALVLELASQLQGERAHRLALETVLRERGLVDDAALVAAGASQACRDASRAAVEASVARLVRVLTEQQDPRTPLRSGGPGEG